MWRDEGSADPVFTDTLQLDLKGRRTINSGPKRPQDRVVLAGADKAFADAMQQEFNKSERGDRFPVEGTDFDLGNGDVVVAAITSCTNTSNPSVLIAAGLVARNARGQGPDGQALGKNISGAGFAGGHGLSEQGRPVQRARCDGL